MQALGKGTSRGKTQECQRKPHHQQLSDFQVALGEDNLSKALRLVTRKHPDL